jgi:hypothetical protein
MVAKQPKTRSPRAAVKKTAAATPVAEAPVAAAVEAAAAETAAPAIETAAVAAAPKPALRALAKKAVAAASSAPSYADVASYSRDNVAAVARANAALVSGFEAIGQEMAGFAQASMTNAVNTARALVGVRTLADLVAVNRDLAQATFEGMIANSARLSEIGMRIASDAFAPFGERVGPGFWSNKTAA